jgi:hypothetical protein
VGVERHHERGSRYARPDAEVDLIAANHPAQKEVQALAAAAG